jgi:uncharacterized protein (TIGR02118 family)
MLIFSQPDDPTSFEERWSNEFVASAEALPGLRRVAVSRFRTTLSDPLRLYLVHELYFDDLDAVQQAMASIQGQNAGQTLMSIAQDFVSVLIAEHMEEDRPLRPKSSSRLSANSKSSFSKPGP